MEISNMATKVIFVVHLFLVTVAILGGWPGNAYLLYNLLIFLLLLWGIIDRASEEPYFMIFYCELLSIFLDIIVMINAASVIPHSLLSLFFVIFNMVLRVYVLLTAARVHSERLGRPDSEKWVLLGIGRAEETIRRQMGTGVSFGGAGPVQTRARTDYENVDSSGLAAAPPFRVDPIFDIPQQPPLYSQVQKDNQHP